MNFAPSFAPKNHITIRVRGVGFTLVEMLMTIVIIAALAAMIVPVVDESVDESKVTAAHVTMQTLREALTGSAAAPGYFADTKHLPSFSNVDFRLHDLLSPSRVLARGGQLYESTTRRGWRGPYLRNAQGVANVNENRNGTFPASHERRHQGDETFLERLFYVDASTSPYGQADANELTVADPWGNPIVFQVPSASVSGSTLESNRFRYVRLVSAGPDGELNTNIVRNDPLAGMQSDGSATVRGDDIVLFLNRADVYEAP